MKEKLSAWRWALGSLLLSSALATGLWGLGSSDVMADRGSYTRGDDDSSGGNRRGRAPANAQYQEECGSCHLAYPPHLLGGEQWQQMMNGLEDHFGENAELDAATTEALSAYLVGNAADNGRYNNRRYASNNLDQLRISQQSFFLRKHDEIPTNWVVDNPEIGSFSRCDACHQNAAKGDFDEHGVVIPGHGRWDD
ncbi:diheme cytochrome c [Motiliproteus sediminis]|uniref:diheme cytochrome c n=1 Tax=Motiliproteus sediminis TaxID=1468178 RepID=UPI001AEF8164|nr:diheme cytochrome c [Motiliproteus sediminis]